MKKSGLTFMAIIALAMTGCASHYTGNSVADPYGFFSGFWHGLIFPIAVVVNVVSWMFSLFDISFLRDIEIVGRPNNGFFYYLGFFFGLSAAAGSGSRS